MTGRKDAPAKAPPGPGTPGPGGIAVLGIGNVLMRDDAIGPYVVRVLEASCEFPDTVSLFDAGTPGHDMALYMEGRDALIVVDAVDAAGPPGDLRLYPLEEIVRTPPPQAMSPHEPGLKDALLKLRFTGGAPGEGILVGVIPEEVLRDLGEPGLPGWTIEIWDEGGPLDSAVTDDNGAYSLTCVNPGQFYVREVPVGGWVQTTPVEECFLPAPDDEEGPLPLGPCYTIDMRPDEILADVNFGNVEGVAVALDIKPQSCRNPLKFKATGTLPVAILETKGFGVKEINMNTVRLEGVSPLRWSMEDVGAPFYPLLGKKDAFDCTTDGPDGFKDVVMHFSMKSL